MANHILTQKYRSAFTQSLHLLIFLPVMALVFHLTFNVIGEALRGLLTQWIGAASFATTHLMEAWDAPFLLRSLVLKGIFPGVGSVLSFVPTIGTLFFFLSLLEKSGYLSYVAALMDKPMRRIGLTGRAVVPLISGFGCNVPAIMTAGSLLKGREKIMVITMMPFISCSARLPIYAIFITAFFEKHRLLTLAAVYGVGLGIAIATALLLKRASKHSKSMGPIAKIAGRFVDVDMPSKVFPHPSFDLNISSPIRLFHKSLALIGVALQIAWNNCLDFIKKAFTVILLASVVVWFLRTFGTELTPVNDIGDSLLAVLGKAAVPIFEPLGFGDWQASSALISGLFAKETIISTLAMLSASDGVSVAYAASFSGSSSALLTEAFTPLSAFCFMAFCLLYIPCIPTLAAVKRETDSIRFCIALCLFQLITAWLVSFLLFQAGSLIMQV